MSACIVPFAASCVISGSILRRADQIGKGRCQLDQRNIGRTPGLGGEVLRVDQRAELFARTRQRQADAAELLADEFGISRDEQDAFALRSHDLANQANNNGRFAEEIVAVEVRQGKRSTMVEKDDHLFPGTSLERLAAIWREGRC